MEETNSQCGVYTHSSIPWLYLEIRVFHQTDPAVEQELGPANMWPFPSLTFREATVCIVATIRMSIGSADPSPGILPHLSRWSCSAFLVAVVWLNCNFQQSPTPAFHGSRQTVHGSTPMCVGDGYYCLFCCQCAPKWMQHCTKNSINCFRLHNEMLVVLAVHHFHL